MVHSPMFPVQPAPRLPYGHGGAEWQSVSGRIYEQRRNCNHHSCDVDRRQHSTGYHNQSGKPDGLRRRHCGNIHSGCERQSCRNGAMAGKYWRSILRTFRVRPASTLSFAATTAQNGNSYRAVFTNSCSTATTTAATLTGECQHDYHRSTGSDGLRKRPSNIRDNSRWNPAPFHYA